MAAVTVIIGVLLTALGGAAYVWTGMEHLTALIPSAFGLVLVALGLLAFKEHLRKHVMHAAVLIGLIGFVIPAVMAFPKLPALLANGSVARADGSDATRAVLTQLAMLVLCGIFVGLCVNSFIQARIRQRRQAAS
jgi:hypothetical protein